jgi:hypothetical protein
MIRSLSLLLALALAGVLSAQDSLTELRQSAEKSAADWQSLAKNLETKISTLLPCDPKGRAAVEEVSRASEVRLAALSAYLKAAALKAKADTDAAKQVLAIQASIAGGWNTERAEADQQRITIEAQVADLKESMRKRAALAPAEQVLVDIARMTKERADKAEEQAAHKDSLSTLLGSLVVAYQDRQTALETESTQITAEGIRWNAYYSARIARAITECSIISAPAPARKKQLQ